MTRTAIGGLLVAAMLGATGCGVEPLPDATGQTVHNSWHDRTFHATNPARGCSWRVDAGPNNAPRIHGDRYSTTVTFREGDRHFHSNGSCGSWERIG